MSISKNFKRKAAKTQSFYFMNTEKTKENTLLELTIPVPLRRFSTLKINENKVVILGGLTTNTKSNNKTYVVDFKENKIEEGKKLPKGGILEQEIIFEEDGKIHLFFEKNFGIEPHEHVVMDFFDLFNL